MSDYTNEQRKLQADLGAALFAFIMPQVQAGKPFRDIVPCAITEVVDQLAKLIAPIHDPDARSSIILGVIAALPELVEERRQGAIQSISARMSEFGSTVQ